MSADAAPWRAALGGAHAARATWDALGSLVNDGALLSAHNDGTWSLVDMVDWTVVNGRAVDLASAWCAVLTARRAQLVATLARCRAALAGLPDTDGWTTRRACGDSEMGA